MPLSINPATNERIASYEEFTPERIRDILDAADGAFLSWRKTSFGERSGKMLSAAKVLRNRKFEFAHLMTREMGKPIVQAEAEIEKCAWVCEYYAENAEKFLADEVIATDATKSFVAFQPLGVVLAVMPWNFPFWQVFRFAVPALMAGNTCILKHASNVTGCALAIESIFREAEFPIEIFRTVIVSSNRVADLIKVPIIKAVTLTGSTPAGIAVASAAGSVLKKSVLELGGSDPYVVLKDADLKAAAEACVTARLINGGQSCIAAKRFIVEQPVFRDFVTLFLDSMRTRKMGSPLERDTDLGPLARMDLRDELNVQVEKSIVQGAETIMGCVIPDMPGAWYPPSVLVNVEPGMAAFDEELFGPVAAIISAKDENDALMLANLSDFGLGAALFTADIEKGEHLAKHSLHAGSCFINSYVKSDPRLPFGGIKDSGYGRELSHYGIKEFMNIKSVYIK